MFLTFSFAVTDAKNDDGQGSKRRRHGHKPVKARHQMTGLSRRKQVILEEVARAFSLAYQRCVQFGQEHWDEIPFTFPLQKDGQSVLDKQGQPRFGKMKAHYLANWLSGRVDLSGLGLHSLLGNGARNQAAETLLSQHKLRLMAADNPRRLTSKNVGVVVIRPMDARELVRQYDEALIKVSDPVADEETIGVASHVLAKPLTPRYMTVLFSGPTDFLLFQHRLDGRLYVALPMLGRGHARATRSALTVRGAKRLQRPLNPLHRSVIHRILYLLLPASSASINSTPNPKKPRKGFFDSIS